MQTAAERIIQRHRRRHVFKVFRNPLRKTVGVLFLAYTFVDYLYIPDYWKEGLVLRLVWYAGVCLAFYSLGSRKFRERYVEWVPSLVLTAACWILDWMIHRSGGYLSLYITPLILVNVTGLQIIGFPRRFALLTNIGSYVPAVYLIWSTAGFEHWEAALVETTFLCGMTALAWLYKSSGDADTVSWALQQHRIQEEVQGLRRTEYLKKYFPVSLRSRIESGVISIPPKKLHESAVLGFADICASTSIANQVDIAVDWELKERFLEAAVKRATESGLIVLSQLGDGCFFIANYEGAETWPLNVVAFFENLLIDYRIIASEIGINHVHNETGIKFGLSMGPAIVGFIGKDQPYFTANGPDANLAARLCSEAQRDELVVSSRVWSVLRKHITGWDVRDESFSLKGFSAPTPAVRIAARLRAKGNRPTCSTCGALISVVSTADGLLDVKCANGHVGNQAGVSFNQAA